MQTVHIYVETDIAAPQSAERISGYVLECITGSGKTVTKERFQKKIGTYHQVILQTLAEALERINKSCEVHIHTQNTFILNMVERNLPGWAEHDFRNAKGELIKNHSQWSRVWKAGQKHLLVPEEGMHPYHNWMTDEMMRMKTREA